MPYIGMVNSVGPNAVRADLVTAYVVMHFIVLANVL